MSLEGFFAGFDRWVADPSPERLAAFVAAHPGWSPDPRRLAIYARHARIHVCNAVEKTHPATRAALAEATWAELLAAWYATRPARSFEINHAAEGFHELLLGRSDLPGWIPWLARLEWELFRTRAFGEDPGPAGPEGGPLRPNPSLVPLEHPWLLCGWLARASRGGQPERGTCATPPEAGAELALVWREPRTFQGCWRSAGPRELLALKVAAEGIAPTEAARQGGVSEDEVLTLLRAARDDGLICGQL